MIKVIKLETSSAVLARLCHFALTTVLLLGISACSLGEHEGVKGRMGGDRDGDGVADVDDNCPTTPNPGQADTDRDRFGDACDNSPNGDDDGDGDAYVKFYNASKNAPAIFLTIDEDLEEDDEDDEDENLISEEEQDDIILSVIGDANAEKDEQSKDNKGDKEQDKPETAEDETAEKADDEDGEQDYVEICEYVRVVAMTIFLECNAATPATKKPKGERLH